MSEVKNSTTDIDNNVQEAVTTPTPKKRMSRAEKARLESEELLKSLGVTIESGRQTRSSRRGTDARESPKPETPKRKQPSTPRASKKAKVAPVDQTDSANHVEKSNKNETQIAEASTTNSVVPDKVENVPVASETVSNNSEQKMEVDTQVESKQPEVQTQSEPVPQPETIEDSPIVETSAIDDEPPIEEDSLPIVDEVVESVPTKTVEQPEVLEIEDVSAAADTTTTIVINDTVPIITSPPESNKDKDEPIELQSSPSEIDDLEDTVTNSQVITTEPDAIVDLESSSNEGDTRADGVNNSQALNSLDLEVINSDSSLGVGDDQPSSGIEATVQEQTLPTSTADVTITEVAPVANTNDNSVHSSERPQNAVESANNQKPIEIPDNFRTTITVDNPREESITTTSETLLKPNATTA